MDGWPDRGIAMLLHAEDACCVEDACCRRCLPVGRRRAGQAALLACGAALLVIAATAEGRAWSGQGPLDLTIRPLDLQLHKSGPLEAALGAEYGLRRGLAADEPPELSIRAGAVGLSLRPEDGRLKPDMFYDLSGWKLRTRIVSGDSPLEIEGMVLRAAHALPLFGATIGTADLP
jgi:hypothetical protein